MKIVMSGASGLIGHRLLAALARDNHSLHVLSRGYRVSLPSGVGLSVWNPDADEPPAESFRGAGAVIHLAGAPVAQRWTARAKQRIRSSRVDGTRHLVRALAKLPEKPEVLVCASAIGYFGSRGDEILTESSAAGSGYLPEVCTAWEREARVASALGIRVVTVRTGIALDPGGGALRRMLPPFRLGAGGKLGSGAQWMSWIHLDDLAALFQFALTHPVSGPLNGVAPNPVTNAEFTRTLAGALGRPAIFPIPGFGLRLLFGEMAELLLGSQRAVPQAAQAAGFTFRHPQLAPALADLLRISSS